MEASLNIAMPWSQEAVETLADLNKSPQDLTLRAYLVNALRRTHHYQDALRISGNAPNFEKHAIFCANYAGLLAAIGQHRPATLFFKHSLSLNSQLKSTAFGLSLSLLALGEYQEGWRFYEERWNDENDTSHTTPYNMPLPFWDGTVRKGLRLMLWVEQGLGDGIQFLRYAILLAQKGLNVTIAGPPEISALKDCLSLPLNMISWNPNGVLELPEIDAQAPLMSLPYLLNEGTPSAKNIPYIISTKNQASKWEARINALNLPPQTIKIGLVWGGRPMFSPSNSFDLIRSFPLDDCAPFLNLPHCTFFSLQKGEPSKQLEQWNNVSKNRTIIDLSHHLNDLSETAAFISQLDLIISCDTSVVHLAGAMGHPVWLLSRYVGCWRWLIDKNYSPWYPSMRIFHQTAMFQWEQPINAITTELQKPSIKANC